MQKGSGRQEDENRPLSPEIQELILKLAQVEVDQDQNIFTMTVAELKDRYCIIMTKRQNTWFRGKRQLHARERKKSAEDAKVAQKKREAERKIYSLVGLTGMDLINRLIELEYANRKEGLRGRASINQLMIALNNHTPGELDRIIIEIKKFIRECLSSDEYSRAEDAIKRVISHRDVLKINERDQFPLTELNDDQLRDEFSQLYNSSFRQNWMPLFEKILEPKLQALGDKPTILAFKKRLSILATSEEFTQQIKQYTLDVIDNYLKYN